jgi:cell division inhibitor SulA/protein ImuA
MDNMLKQTVDMLLEYPQLHRADHRCRPVTRTVPSGHADLDLRLPDGGWPCGALTEVLLPRPGIGELPLLLPALQRLHQQRRWIALVAPPYIPYAPAWEASGVDISRLLWVRPRTSADAQQAMEQALRSGTCDAVLGWSEQSAGFGHIHRLQRAAEAGDCMGILFNPEDRACHATPAALRVRLEADAQGVQVHLLKSGRDRRMHERISATRTG